MKYYTSLKSAKKSIIIQVVCLSACLLILGFVLWLSSQRRFILDLPFGKIDEVFEDSEAVIEWKGEAIPVESYEVRYVMTPQENLNIIHISMPE